jgi:predicted amidohydrolase YtcJ
VGKHAADVLEKMYRTRQSWRWNALLTAVAAVSVFSPVEAVAQEKANPAFADTLIVHARIYTQNPRQPWAEAVAILGDKIAAIGSEGDMAAYRGPDTKVIDGAGRLVLPGFTDSHIHFLDGSLSLLQVNLEQAKTVDEIQQRVKTYAKAHPELPWILGRGWQYTTFGASGMPTKGYLDQIVSDRAVYLESFDGHTWWANSKALELAGVAKGTPDPPGGKFVRDPVSGELTGAVKEDSADAVIRRAIPRPSREKVKEALRLGMQEANKVGLVRGISPGGVSVEGGDFTALDVYDELRREGLLTMRFYIALRIEPLFSAEQIDKIIIDKIKEAQRRYHDEWIAAGAAKFFLDGVIESHTAAMLAPYSDDPSQSGNLWWEPEKYKHAVAQLEGAGVQVYTHAIGDKAVRLALDAYEEARSKTGRSDMRPRIEHIETISAQDIPRFGQLGVIASFQPLHAYPDDDLMKVWAPHIGPERAQRGWVWRSIEKTGGVLAFGSDWPIVTLNPWPGVQNALTRQTTEGEPRGGYLPNERISLEDAIKGYTWGAAFAAHREKEEGSLEAGKLADLILLSQDLFKIPPSEIGKTEVLLTMVGGKVVYESPQWKARRNERPEGK